MNIKDKEILKEFETIIKMTKDSVFCLGYIKSIRRRCINNN